MTRSKDCHLLPIAFNFKKAGIIPDPLAAAADNPPMVHDNAGESRRLMPAGFKDDNRVVHGSRFPDPGPGSANVGLVKSVRPRAAQSLKYLLSWFACIRTSPSKKSEASVSELVRCVF